MIMVPLNSVCELVTRGPNQNPWKTQVCSPYQNHVCLLCGATRWFDGFVEPPVGSVLIVDTAWPGRTDVEDDGTDDHSQLAELNQIHT